MAALIVFLSLSFLLVIASIVWAVINEKRHKHSRKILSLWHILTIGVFFGLFAINIPLSYNMGVFNDVFVAVRPLLIAFQSTMRIFILDSDFSELIYANIKTDSAWLKLIFSSYALVLYVSAPALTFVNIMAMFKNIGNELTYWFRNPKKLYILSALNQRSIILAESIFDEASKNGDKESMMIVFTDVFTQNEEDDFELISRARNIKAICLKRDIGDLNFYRKRGNIEIYFINENESENVSQSVRVARTLNVVAKEKDSVPKCKLFVLSKRECDACLIDSVDCTEIMRRDNSFCIRRVNDVRQLIWSIVPQMNLFDIMNKKADKTLSVLILGMGFYGIEFFKMLLWYCQFDGYNIKLNVFDKDNGNGDIKGVINRNYPELLKTNRCNVDGEARYDIEIISDIDVRTAEFDALFLNEGKTDFQKNMHQRLKDVDVAIVALGNDDLNIETAIHLRELTDKAHSFKANGKTGDDAELVDIYAIVYDNRKSGVVSGDGAGGRSDVLVNYDLTPYHINFVGAMSERNKHKNFYNEELDKKARAYHTEWVDIDRRVYEELKAEGYSDEELNKEYWGFTDKDNCDNSIQDNKYNQFEYFRLSSMAKKVHRDAIVGNDVLRQLTKCERDTKKCTCKCEACVRAKKSEHMRWNAYMRTVGYSFNEISIKRAKCHSNLVSWNELDEVTRAKDSSILE